MYACGHIDSFYDAQVRSLHSWCRDLCDVRVQLDSCVPVEAALAPIGLTEVVCDFDRFAFCTPSFHDDTARSAFCTESISLTSQPVSMVSAPRLTAPRKSPRRLMSSTSLRFSVRTPWSIGLRGRNSDGGRGPKVIGMRCQVDVSISGTVLTSGMVLISAMIGTAALGAASRALSIAGPPVSMARRLFGTSKASVT